MNPTFSTFSIPTIYMYVYRIYLNKRPGAYLIFGLLGGGAVIREGRLFEGGRLLNFHHFSRKYI